MGFAVGDGGFDALGHGGAHLFAEEVDPVVAGGGVRGQVPSAGDVLVRVGELDKRSHERVSVIECRRSGSWNWRFGCQVVAVRQSLEGAWYRKNRVWEEAGTWTGQPRAPGGVVREPGLRE